MLEELIIKTISEYAKDYYIDSGVIHFRVKGACVKIIKKKDRYILNIGKTYTTIKNVNDIIKLDAILQDI